MKEKLQLTYQKDASKKDKKNKVGVKQPFYCLTASDPLNFLNLTLPNRRLPRLLKNRVLFQGGIPIAMLDSGEVHYLRDIDLREQWNIQQMLLKRNFPIRLRSYLGSR